MKNFKIFLMSMALCTSLTAFAQQVVKGVVTEASSGEPLPGVDVIVKGTTRGTSTDFDGNYNIEVKKGDVLTFSYMGFQAVEITIGDKTTINVALKEEAEALDEVVLIGYGSTRKKDATGSVSAVSSDDFNKGAITSAQDLLTGKSAGVVITSAGGAPGSGSTIRIRGGSSLNASNDPLIIVDGVPLSNNGVSGDSNFLSFVNPNDIETFTVLKDASATAIYGSRASNGVILITTKKGKRGNDLKISYNGSISIASPISYIDVYSADEFRKIVLEKKDIFNVGTYDKLGAADTDWQKEIFRNSVSYDHNINFSGAYKDLPYRFSVGYTNQEGILKNTDMQRITGSINLNPVFLDGDLKVNFSGKGMYTKNNFGDTGAIGSAVSMDPTQPIMDGNSSTAGYFQWPTYGANLGTPNPVEQLMAADNKSDVKRFIGNVQINYAIPFLEGLKANLNVATDYAEGEGYNNRPVTSPSVLVAPSNWGKLSDYTSIKKNNLLDFYLNYVKDFGENHRLDLTGGYSWQHFSSEGSEYTRSVADASHPLLEISKSENATENYLVSFFGRANYSLLNRYLFTATIRYDGSSRFADGNRWGVFPSFAFAWKINNEKFFENFENLSNLKMRLGWGITGQQDIGNDYPAQAKYVVASPGSYYYINGKYVPTLRPDAYDPNIKWEETTTQNIGLDFGFYEDRITGSIDAYKRTTKDLLNTVTVPSGSNFSNRLLTNVGSLENTGVEISLNIVPIQTENSSLDIGLNFTYNKNEITKLLLTDDPNYIGILYGSAMTGQNQVTRVGHPAYSFFVNKQIYDTNGDPIEGLYQDISGKGGVVNGDNEDKYIYQKPVADYLLGFSVKYNYKNLTLSASTRANIGNYVYNAVAAGASYDQMQQIGYWKNMPTYLSDTKFVKRQFTSDYFVENASFFKLDNVSVSYDFDKILGDITTQLSLTVQNVFTITNYEGIDPEVNGGIDNNFYPRPRTYMLGVSLNF